MLIGGDDISNDVITLGACFHAFFNVCLILARFRFALIGGNLAAQSTGSHRGIGGGIQILETSFKMFFLFPLRRQSAPESLRASYFLCKEVFFA